jgi:outer membrane protein assembly factor BamA
LNLLSRTLFILAVFSSFKCAAQNYHLKTDTSHRYIADQVPAKIDSSKQRDLGEELYGLIGKKNGFDRKQRKVNVSVVPSAGYTLTTGAAFDLSANAAFYTDAGHNENLSAYLNDFAIDTRKQKYLFSRSEIWAPNNDYKFVTDVRLQEYPTTTYGLGSGTTNQTADNIFYYYLRAYPTFYKKLAPDFYGGFGYDLDDYWGVTEDGNANGTESDFKKYGDPSRTIASGVNFSLLYDNRRNSIYPLGGYYANLTYRQNVTWLGSDQSWQSFRLDLRKYMRLSPNNNNVLAFWGMAWFSSANTPYLDLPTTGGDMYNNSGRGYAVGRFRGYDMLYLEVEYRFGILRNGLIGGVVFANGESFTGYSGIQFQKIAPATGAGIRVKANKKSNTSIGVDYGVGIDGSRGFFINLGEVF